MTSRKFTRWLLFVWFALLTVGAVAIGFVGLLQNLPTVWLLPVGLAAFFFVPRLYPNRK